MLNYKYIEYIFISILILIGLFLLNFNQTMGGMWTGPFLSAVLNFDGSFELRVNIDEVKYFASLSKEAMMHYHFHKTNNLINYDYLSKGLIILIILAKNIFFLVGDLEALKYLQYITHIFIVLIIYSILEKKYQKILFLVLYGVNPIILYYVNFPFYYFWQVIPSVIFIYWYLKKDIKFYLLIIFSIIFAFVYEIRPTVLFLVLFFYIIYGIKNNYKQSFIGFAIFLILINLTPKLSIGPWHTMYIGIGAYKNPYNIKLSDNSGYDYYHQVTGKIANSDNMMKDAVKNDYYKVLKKRYFEILEKNHLLIIKNALLNIMQSYSFGHKVGNMKINYISTLIGLLIMLLLLYTKQYILFFAIGFASGSFTTYYPPIPAYMYGSYLLIVIGIVGIVDFFIRNKKI